MKVVLLFPGQGAQYVGMGQDLYEAYPQAREVFDKAVVELGFDLRRLMFEGPFEELTRTANSQPAIFLHSFAALRVLRQRHTALEVASALGLSLGEYTALVAAWAIGFEDGLRLVRRRGEFMEEAAQRNPGKMASILGLALERVREICKETGAEVANLNCPGQIVISGRNEAVDCATKLAEEKFGVKVVALAVNGPFHSSLMKEAAANLTDELAKIEITAPQIRVISNYTADFEVSPDGIRRNLVSQLTNPVRWEDSVRKILTQDEKANFLEVGPGRVLKGLMRKISPQAQVVNLGTKEELEEFDSSDLK